MSWNERKTPSNELKEIFNIIFDDVYQRGDNFITVEHLLFALLDNGLVASTLETCGANLSKLKIELLKSLEGNSSIKNEKNDCPQFTLGFLRVLWRAISCVKNTGRMEIDIKDVFIAIFHETESNAIYFLNQQNISYSIIIDFLSYKNDINFQVEISELKDYQIKDILYNFSLESKLSLFSSRTNKKDFINEEIEKNDSESILDTGYNNKDFRNQSFKGLNLSNKDFSKSDIRGADLSYTVLVGANFSECIAGIDERTEQITSFKNADLRGTSFYKAKLTGSDFSGTICGKNEKESFLIYFIKGFPAVYSIYLIYLYVFILFYKAIDYVFIGGNSFPFLSLDTHLYFFIIVVSLMILVSIGVFIGNIILFLRHEKITLESFSYFLRRVVFLIHSEINSNDWRGVLENGNILKTTVFSYADVTDADFTSANISDSCFIHTKGMFDCKFDAKFCPEANFFDTSSSTKLQSYIYTIFKSNDKYESQLQKKIFLYSDLLRHQIKITDLSNFIFIGCKINQELFTTNLIEEVKFYNCDIQNINFSSFFLKKISFRGCNMRNANFSFSSLINTKFIDCNLKNINFYRAKFLKVNFFNCKLQKANFFRVKSRIKNIDLACLVSIFFCYIYIGIPLFSFVFIVYFPLPFFFIIIDSIKENLSDYLFGWLKKSPLFYGYIVSIFFNIYWLNQFLSYKEKFKNTIKALYFSINRFDGVADYDNIVTKQELGKVSFELCNLIEADFSYADLTYFYFKKSNLLSGVKFNRVKNLELINFNIGTKQVPFKVGGEKVLVTSQLYSIYNPIVLDLIQKKSFDKDSELPKENNVIYLDGDSSKDLNQSKKYNDIDLKDCDLSNAQLDDIDLTDSNLENTNFSGASLNNAILSNVNASGANFKNTKMSNVNLRNAQLKNALFDSADLTKSDLTDSQAHQAKFDYANLENCIFTESDLYQASFSNANLTNSFFNKAELTQVNFSFAKLNDTNFTKAQLSETNFNESELTGACIENWNINSKTNLHSAKADFVYLQNNQKERRPHSGTFIEDEFGKMFQKITSTLEILFANDINWKAFFVSLENLKIDSGNKNIKVKSIEQKEDGVFVIGLSVPEESDKAQLYDKFKQDYEFLLLKIENQNKQLLINEQEISKYQERVGGYERQVNNLTDILKFQLSRPTTIIQGENMSNVHVGDTFSGNFRGANLNVKSVLKDVNQTIQSLPNLKQEAKVSLEELLKQLEQELSLLPPEKAKQGTELVQALHFLLKDAKDNRPKMALQLTAKGLTEAAEAIAGMTSPVVQTIKSILSIIL